MKNEFWELYASEPYKLINHFRKGLVIDTEPLLIYLVGLYDTRNNTDYLDRNNHKIEEFKLLSRFFEQMNIKKFIITPHILAEFSSLTKKSFKEKFNNFIEQISPNLKEFEENHIEKNEILESEHTKKYGITDIGILLITKKKKFPVLVKDWDLIGLLNKNNIRFVIYFNELFKIK